MKNKILVLGITALIFAGLVLVTATSGDSDKNSQKKTNTNEYAVAYPSNHKGFTSPRSVGMKRVIADTVSEQDIRYFKGRGCLIRHRLRDATSLECPENIVPELNVRESRVFHVMDLEADVQINADDVWAEEIDGTGVTVAVLDTGVQSNHEELSDSIVGCESFVAGETCEDYNGHGTHVAGIITANGVHTIDSNKATGVAPGAEVYMLKVCGEDGYCHEDDMVAAMEYAVDNLDVKVMSISIGGGSYTTENCDSDPLAAKVNWVANNGIVVSVAAGNDGKGVSSPGCASGAIAVGAVDKSGNVVYFSGRGPALDIVAPGVDILSSYSCLAPGAEDCTQTWYAYMSGTSMSTPHVAGVAALLLQTKPSATVDEIKTAMYETAGPVNKCYRLIWGRWQREVTCTPEITGAGVVNAYEAYLAIKPTGPVCSSDAECDDGNPCTNDICVYPGETNAYCKHTAVADDTPCDDGQFCTLSDVCTAGVCGGVARDCPDGVDCTVDSCDEVGDACVNTPNDANCPADGWVDTGDIQWVSSGECTEKEQKEQEYRDYYCDAISDCQYSVIDTKWIDTGVAGNKADGTACDDGDSCTGDDVCSGGVCTRAPITECKDGDGCCPAGCDYTSDSDCSSAVKCWSAEYNYLKRSTSQFKKFCKCAEGNYGYSSYSYVRGRQIAYQYVDSGNNENWETKSVSTYYPAYRIKCTDEEWYNTNEDYYA